MAVLVKGKRLLKNEKPYFEICFMLLLFLISVLVYFMFVTNKLNIEEYESVSSLYAEINVVDTDGRSDFYINNTLKILDKSTVLTNLRKDSLKYTLLVSDNMTTMLSEGYEISYILSYLNRCNLDFNTFKDLGVNSEIFELQKGLLNSLNVGDLDVEDYVKDSYSLVDTEQNELLTIKVYDTLLLLGYILIYVVVGCVWVKIKRGYRDERNKK